MERINMKIDSSNIKVIRNGQSLEIYYHCNKSFDNYVICITLQKDSFNFSRIAIPRYNSDESICDELILFSLRYMKEVFDMNIGYFPEYLGHKGTIEFNIQSGKYFGYIVSDDQRIYYQSISPLELLKSFKSSVEKLTCSK